MIPRVIHYCWFGGKPLPDSALKCINSWRKFFPGFEIKEWNESNFDVNAIRYTKQAYEAHKYAFVSDYARFWILYNYGGLYFDTDVEVINPMFDILERGSFMGIEIPAIKQEMPKVNPGLGLGVCSGLSLFREMLNTYSQMSFRNPNGSLNQKTIVDYTTELLSKNGLRLTNDLQQVEGIWIYPADFFNPLNSLTGKMNITGNTRSIHWYMNSWSDSSSFRRWISRVSHKLFGMRLHYIIEWLRGILNLSI